MKAKWLVLLLLTGSSLFAGPRVFIGVGVGGFGYGYYAPPPPAVAYAPPCPGPGYAWIGGYWDPSGPRYAWRAGYWLGPLIRMPIGLVRVTTGIVTTADTGGGDSYQADLSFQTSRATTLELLPRA